MKYCKVLYQANWFIQHSRYDIIVQKTMYMYMQYIYVYVVYALYVVYVCVYQYMYISICICISISISICTCISVYVYVQDLNSFLFLLYNMGYLEATVIVIWLIRQQWAKDLPGHGMSKSSLLYLNHSGLRFHLHLSQG